MQLLEIPLIVLTATASSISPGNAPEINKPFIWTISLVAALGGLLFGYDWVVIGGAKPFFEPFFHLSTDALKGWANSCALVGCLLGSLVSGGLSDRFGRKKLMLVSAFLFAVSSVLAIGMASNLSPMYIAEVAPAEMRGQLVAINQLTIVIGVLLAQIANLLIARKVPDGATVEMIRQSWNGIYGWRWMFTAVAAPSIVFFLGSIYVPESPRWLVKNGRADRAQKILERIGGKAYAEAEVRDVQATITAGEIQQVRFADLLERKMLKILLVGCTLAVLQQWSGINVIFNYADEIFRAAGYGVSSILLNIVITGVVMLLFTFIAINTVDRFGRRILMLVGCAGISFFHALIGCAYRFHFQGLVVVIPVLATIACYSFSLAPVTWVLIAEIFPNRIRGAAVSVAVSALWIACFILTYTFPLLNGVLGPAMTFWLYSGICAAGFVFIFLRVPETKGKTLEQIERDLVD